MASMGKMPTEKQDNTALKCPLCNSRKEEKVDKKGWTIEKLRRELLKILPTGSVILSIGPIIPLKELLNV